MQRIGQETGIVPSPSTLVAAATADGVQSLVLKTSGSRGTHPGFTLSLSHHPSQHRQLAIRARGAESEAHHADCRSAVPAHGVLRAPHHFFPHCQTHSYSRASGSIPILLSISQVPRPHTRTLPLPALKPSRSPSSQYALFVVLYRVHRAALPSSPLTSISVARCPLVPPMLAVVFLCYPYTCESFLFPFPSLCLHLNTVSSLYYTVAFPRLLRHLSHFADNSNAND